MLLFCVSVSTDQSVQQQQRIENVSTQINRIKAINDGLDREIESILERQHKNLCKINELADTL